MNNIVNPKISTQILLPVVERLRVIGERATPLLEDVGINPDDLSDINKMVLLKDYVRFFELAAQKTGRAHFGLEAGKSITSDSLGALGFLFASAPSLNDALSGLASYISALQEGTVIKLTGDGSEARYEYQISSDMIKDRRQDSEYSLAASLTLMRQFIGRDFQPKEVCFEHERIGNHSYYEKQFGCHVFFNQPVNYILLEKDTLKLGSPSLSDKLYPIIANHLNELILAKGNIESFADQVTSLMTNDSLESGISLDGIASKLGLSKSTITRRLKSEGKTFNQLLTEKRIQLAKRLLKTSRVSIAQIALKTGYSENASFTRAFKNHTGISPEQYRRSSLLN